MTRNEKMKAGETYKAVIAELGELRKIHIVQIIDEGLLHSPLVVYRYFGKHKQWWHYFIKTETEIKAMIDRVSFYIQPKLNQ